MKKLLLFVSLGIAIAGVAQNSIQITNMSNSSTIAVNGTVHIQTSAGNNVNRLFDIKNTSASTQTYVLKRYDGTLNSGAAAYFCFAGSCFGPGTVVSGSLVLTAGQSASNYTTAYTTLTADLDEGATVGQSTVKYSFRNAVTVADSFQIVLRYNDPTASIKEYVSPFKSFDVSPNPANENVNITLNHKGSSLGEVSLINALGQTVYTKQIGFVEGKNKVSIDINELPNGIYFAKIKSGEFTDTKKITVQ